MIGRDEGWVMTDQQLPEETRPPSSTPPVGRRRWRKPMAVATVSLALLGLGTGVGMALDGDSSGPVPSASAPTTTIAPRTPATTLPGTATGKHAGQHAKGKHKAQPVTPTTAPAPPAG